MSDYKTGLLNRDVIAAMGLLEDFVWGNGKADTEQLLKALALIVVNRCQEEDGE